MLTENTELKDPKDVSEILDLMLDCLAEIELTLNYLTVAIGLIDNQDQDKKLKRAFYETQPVIIKNLNRLSEINAELIRYLFDETRQIPLNPRFSPHANMRVEHINDLFELYYNDVKGKIFPRPDDEVEELKDIIVKLNSNIARINEINSVYTPRQTLQPVKNLSNSY